MSISCTYNIEPSSVAYNKNTYNEYDYDVSNNRLLNTYFFIGIIPRIIHNIGENEIEFKENYIQKQSYNFYSAAFVDKAYSYNEVIDLMKVENLNKIKKMEGFKNNWDGNNGNAFSRKSIRLFYQVIQTLEKQPEIAPTGKGSLFMQYELEDKSLLAFDISPEKTEKVFVPKGEYDKADTEYFLSDIPENIKNCVERFYEN